MSLVKGVHHIALKCKNKEQFMECIHFYHEILGLDILRSWGEGSNTAAMLQIGDDILEIFASGCVGNVTGAINHFAFAVDDVDACVEAVRAEGYTITTEPTDMIIRSIPYLPIRVAFCIGPVGEEVEFFKER